LILEIKKKAGQSIDPIFYALSDNICAFSGKIFHAKDKKSNFAKHALNKARYLICGLCVF